MVKKFVFNFKLDVDDKRLLALVAHHLQRTQADAIRWLIRRAAGRLPNLPDDDDDWYKAGQLEEELP